MRLSPTRAYVLALFLLVVGIVLVVQADGLPWLTLAVVLGIVATHGWGRIIASVLLLAGGLVAAGGGIADLVGGSPGSGLAALAGGLLIAAAALWSALQGRRWPAMGGRYERTPGPEASSSRRAVWDALDHGRDPTDDPKDEPTDGSAEERSG